MKAENSCHIPRHINCLAIFQEGSKTHRRKMLEMYIYLFCFKRIISINSCHYILVKPFIQADKNTWLSEWQKKNINRLFIVRNWKEKTNPSTFVNLNLENRGKLPLQKIAQSWAGLNRKDPHPPFQSTTTTQQHCSSDCRGGAKVAVQVVVKVVG